LFPEQYDENAAKTLLLASILRTAIYSVASLLALDNDQILQIAKDSGGSRVLEAFLCSSATAKRKFKVFAK
jgi:hypothetical protein